MTGSKRMGRSKSIKRGGVIALVVGLAYGLFAGTQTYLGNLPGYAIVLSGLGTVGFVGGGIWMLVLSRGVKL